MMAAGKVMAEFVGQKNHQEREGKRKSGNEAGGMFVEKAEGAEKLVKRSGIVLRVGRRELRAGHEAGAQGQKKKEASEDERFDRRTGKRTERL